MTKRAFAYSRVGKQGVHVASGVAENPSEFVRIRRQGEITPRQQDFIERLAAQDDFGIGLAIG